MTYKHLPYIYIYIYSLLYLFIKTAQHRWKNIKITGLMIPDAIYWLLLSIDGSVFSLS